MSTGRASSLRGILLAGAAALGLGMAATPADATILSYTLNVEFSGGATPVTPLKVTLNDNATAGQIVTTLDFQGPPVDTDEFVREIYFNTSDGAPTTISGFGGSATQPTLSTTGLKADGDGTFDFKLVFDTAAAGRFNGGDVLTFTMSGGTTVAQMVGELSSGASNAGPLPIAAHVGGIGPTGDSGWITVPLPAAAWLFGPALLGLWGARRWKAEAEPAAA
jgi:hypothetical protein